MKITGALAALFLAAVPIEAGAQRGFPSRPVTIIVPFAPGGTADLIPRMIAEKLRERWGQPVVVENRPGNAGNTGTGVMARAEPDGYTLLASPAGTLVINQFVQKKLPFDPDTIVPVALLARTPIALSVRTDLPATSVRELIDLAKKSPGKITYATQGPGSTAHLTTVMFQTMTGVDLVHVPYRGSAPALTDLMAGNVDMMFDTYTSSATYHAAGKLRLLAVATAQRLAFLPDMPTVREAGLAEFESTTWYGMMAPPGTPDTIVDQINRDVVEVLAMPEMQAKIRAGGIEPGGGTRAEFAAFMARERKRWERVTAAAKMVPE